MKKFGDILPVTGVPAIGRMRLVGVITSFFDRLLTRIDNEQSRRLLGHKVVDCYKAMAILILNALVLCAGLELAAKSSFKIRSLISSPAEQLVGEGNPREKVSYYSSQDWAKRYWYEFRLSRNATVLPLRWLEESSFQRRNHKNRSEWRQIDARRGLQRQIF